MIYQLFLKKSIDCSQLCPYESILTNNRLIFDKTHSIEHYSEFVCPQNFRNLADWVYGWPDNVFEEKIEVTTSEHIIAPCLPSGSIIFVKPDDSEKFFHDIYPYLINKFVLITAQGDASSPNKFLSYLHDTDSKIIHWFGQNTDIDSQQTNKFTSIPIGINCYEMANGIRYIHQQNSNNTLPSLFGGTDEPSQYSHLLDITYNVLNGYSSKRLLLINFQKMTDPTGLRSQLWKVFCRRRFTSAFVECIDKPNGVNISSLPSIYIRNRQYPFWLSPRGNGLDCHRTWEALYLDTIPIVWNMTLNPLFVDLPVIVINNYNELTEQFLRTKLNEIAKNKVKNPSFYRFEKLRFSYWRRMILSKSRYSTTTTRRQNQCWRAKTVTKTN
ncbi:unnamed protein product [Adineta steineri]|uniref:Uncharacterized protein n=1 Tax=Adineta steineri TaxID=433720 RepID=A0A813NEX8_9BILA|nr:unnamed protein product [Adineta steineri]CAF3823600.1 unnamed protein product [Adineta steineri]